MPELHSDQRRLIEQIVRAAGKSVAGFGLRFDRVVARVLGELRRYAEHSAPADTTVLLTLTAPIREPARTTHALEQKIAALIETSGARAERSAVVCGNSVRLRRVTCGPPRRHAFIGFVHNPNTDSRDLLDLAEQWLGAARARKPKS